MWSLDDAVCAQVASSFYKGLLSEDKKGEGEVRTNQAQKVNAEKSRVMKDGGGNQSKAVSKLLHAIVMEVRSKNLDRPTYGHNTFTWELEIVRWLTTLLRHYVYVKERFIIKGTRVAGT